MPISKMHDLSDETIEFLKELRKQDIDDIRDTITLYHTIKGVSKLIKWFVISIIGTFMALTTFWSSIIEIKAFLFGGK